MPQHPRFWKTKEGSVALTNKNLLFRPHCFKSRLALYGKKTPFWAIKCVWKGIHATLSLQERRFHYWKEYLSRYSRNKTLQCRKFDWGFFHSEPLTSQPFLSPLTWWMTKKDDIYSIQWKLSFQWLIFDLSGGTLAKLNSTANAKFF